MKMLPDYVMRAPRVFYGLGFLIFFGYLIMGTFGISSQSNQNYVSGTELLAMRARVVLDAFYYAALFVGDGIFLHVQIAIWQALMALRFAGKIEE